MFPPYLSLTDANILPYLSLTDASIWSRGSEYIDMYIRMRASERQRVRARERERNRESERESARERECARERDREERACKREAMRQRARWEGIAQERIPPSEVGGDCARKNLHRFQLTGFDRASMHHQFELVLCEDLILAFQGSAIATKTTKYTRGRRIDSTRMTYYTCMCVTQTHARDDALCSGAESDGRLVVQGEDARNV